MACQLSLQTIFQATVIAKLSYASPAWWGFTSAADKDRLEAFLHRSAQFGYRAASASTFADICAAADDRLLNSITRNSGHLLHPLLPPSRDEHYNLRRRSNHNLQLSIRTTTLNDRNFLMRALHKDMNYSQASSQH